MYSKDKPIPKLLDKLKFLDMGNAPLYDLSIDTAGPFLKDSNSSVYLLAAIDPLSK